jgi:hypothetical protein
MWRRSSELGARSRVEAAAGPFGSKYSKTSSGEAISASLGDCDHPPPEPGFARREARNARLKYDCLGRLLKLSPTTTALKEGARGGTRGCPTKAAR